MSDSRAIPLVATLLALLWCLAQLLSSAYLATATAVAVIAATLALALQRRQGRALPWMIAGIVLILAILLVGLLLTDSQLGLSLQVALIVILAPLVPLVYALTFEPDADNDEPP
jgi:Na+/melibiose symporter-like transporter